MMHTALIAVANQKGGIGKITTCLNPVHATPVRDRKLLRIDYGLRHA
jgi:cellulose biosynthesis protein BcsQ